MWGASHLAALAPNPKVLPGTLGGNSRPRANGRSAPCTLPAKQGDTVASSPAPERPVIHAQGEWGGEGGSRLTRSMSLSSSPIEAHRESGIPKRSDAR